MKEKSHLITYMICLCFQLSNLYFYIYVRIIVASVFLLGPQIFHFCCTRILMILVFGELW